MDETTTTEVTRRRRPLIRPAVRIDSAPGVYPRVVTLSWAEGLRRMRGRFAAGYGDDLISTLDVIRKFLRGL